MSYAIDKNVPMPLPLGLRGGGRTKYPFRSMEIGDSCFIAGMKAIESGSIVHRYRPKKFTARAVTENGVTGVRIWRIA